MIISNETTTPGNTAATPPSPQPTDFAELGVRRETVEALDALGVSIPFPIQALTIPIALAGHDVIGQAKTGTGKTLAFGIPLLQRITVPADTPASEAAADSAQETAPMARRSTRPRRRARRRGGVASSAAPADGRPQALVVVPTRELALQVTNDLLAAGKVRAVRVLAVYGGRAYEPQIEALRSGVDVVVGTPGRLLDLTRQGHIDLSGIDVLVLDEADEMLDLGFLPDVEHIISKLPTNRQTMLFSATMPGMVIALARQYLNQPTHVRAVEEENAGATVAAVAQHVYRAHALDKSELLSRILHADGRGLTMVFCRTKRTCAKLADELTERGFAAAAVHGDLGQGAREQALRAFRHGKVDVLVATDVAARGLDVEGVTHVVNFQCPEDEKVYLHRIGRTARAGNSGTAITLVDWDELARWALINKALDLPFDEPAETYSTSPHLFEELDIPADSTGVLASSRRVREGLDAEELEDLGETGTHTRPARRRREHGAPRRTHTAAVTNQPEQPRGEHRVSTRRTRQRRRTRGGVPVEQRGNQSATSDTVTSSEAD